MATNALFKKIALSFEDTAEQPHFEKLAFRSRKKIFATLLESESIGVALLTPAEQYVFCKMDGKNIYPVPNKWGLKGATYLNIKNLSQKILKEVLKTAYNISLGPGTKTF